MMSVVVDCPPIGYRRKRRNSLFDEIPTEMMEEIFGNLEPRDLMVCRSVSAQWNAVAIRRLESSQRSLSASRLTVSFVDDEYSFVWCKYSSGGRRRQITVRRDSIDHIDLDFCFSPLDIQRLVVENIPEYAMTDEFIDFLCRQVAFCKSFQPIQLTLRGVDLGNVRSDALQSLLVQCSERLEVLEFLDIGKWSAHLLTDKHLASIKSPRLRRLSIQFREKSRVPNEIVGVSDLTLRLFAQKRMFPSLCIGRCSLTASAIVHYASEWLAVANSQLRDVPKTHWITVSDCPTLSSTDLENECREAGLKVEVLTKSSTEISYSLTANYPQLQFIVDLNSQQ